jgi:hypothetical protein
MLLHELVELYEYVTVLIGLVGAPTVASTARAVSLNESAPPSASID